GVAADAIAAVGLSVTLRVVDGVLEVDFTGTGGPHRGNLNAPRAVVRAAVLYALRVLVAQPIPLNEGALRRVRITVPTPSIVAPPPNAAVAGGNVETSQRIVDLVLRAAGMRAAGQGTMNNLTLGGEGWTYYETVGGGQGASAKGPGMDAHQVHMTNTRTTDAEVLEARLPLRVRRFGIRGASGGEGHHRGGHGVLRVVEVVRHATASLLATRRTGGAPGLAGGAAGAAGRDRVFRGGRWEDWDGRSIDLAPGDRVWVETPGGGGWGRKC
ncbi:MAG: hydantoinase B/oxoprolinase family protein, partial [Deltaproteobacteria bacterium]|nr:hydantoinase B/oxoprolinase family protein [Deltaproteobacteria bacterium]